MNLEQRNTELEEKLKSTDLPSAVATLQLADKRRKLQMIILGASVFLDLILTIGLGYNSYRTAQLAAKAESNENSIIRSCETTNEARANNKKLWDYVLALPPIEARTPVQEQRVGDFRKFVDETFAPRDCKALMDGTK